MTRGTSTVLMATKLRSGMMEASATTFWPQRIAVGDLTGDGKQDLVLADSYGFFWFFPNSGTPKMPVFTQGEVMPIWLGEERTGQGSGGFDNVVPRIQLVDFDKSKRLDILAGTYTGKLFRIPNIGSPAQPDFKPTVQPRRPADQHP
jgi:hypothetical protein